MCVSAGVWLRAPSPPAAALSSDAQALGRSSAVLPNSHSSCCLLEASQSRLVLRRQPASGIFLTEFWSRCRLSQPEVCHAETILGILLIFGISAAAVWKQGCIHSWPVCVCLTQVTASRAKPSL